MGVIDKHYVDDELVQAREKIKMLEKLIELNMNDFWDVVDQRDWYYNEYQKLKNKKII